MADEQDGPLALVTLDDIHAELERRYEGFVLITTANRDSTTDSMTVRHGGGFALSLGLCELGKRWILDKIGESET